MSDATPSRLSSWLDQAAGLRALLTQSPPEVLAVVPFGAHAMHWIVQQTRLRASLGLRVLAFDEWQISGNFSDCVGVSPRFDLQFAVEGLVRLEDCVVSTQAERLPALSIVSVAKLAFALESSRVLQQRVVDTLSQLQSASDEWLVLARPCELTGLSSFARAAPRILFAVEPAERAITEAYAALKRLARCADNLVVGINMVGGDAMLSRQMYNRFQRLAASQLGVDVQVVTSIGEAMGLLGTSELANLGFAESLLRQLSSPPSQQNWVPHNEMLKTG